MGLKETFQNAAITAVNAAGNVAEDANYTQYGSAVYDVSSGTASAPSSTSLVSFIFSDFAASRVDNHNILPTDLMALTPRSSFPFAPNTDDIVTRVEVYGSVVYEVVNFKTDEAEATWEFQLRKP